MNITTAGSYHFDLFQNRDEESRRLKQRAGMRLEGFIPLLKRHGLVDGMSVLEIGCGHGVRTSALARNFPNSQILGLDLSRALLEEAKKNAFSNVRYLEGNAERLPFADGSVDFVYARLVFMHLRNPLAVIREVKRVLRPGGTFLIEDADRDFMNFNPAPPSWPEFWANIQQGQRAQGGDPNVGRKLEDYLKLSGLGQIKVELQPIHGGPEDVLELCHSLMPALNEYLPVEERGPGTVAIRELAELCRTRGTSLYHLWFVVSGRAP